MFSSSLVHVLLADGSSASASALNCSSHDTFRLYSNKVFTHIRLPPLYTCRCSDFRCNLRVYIVHGALAKTLDFLSTDFDFDLLSSLGQVHLHRDDTVH